MIQKCIVKGCTNNSTDGGPFIGDLCFPCHMAITTGKVGYTDSFLGDMKRKIDKLEKELDHTCNLGDIPGLKEFLGLEPERVPVYVALFKSTEHNAVGARVFSTKERAEAYKKCIEGLPPRIKVTGSVKIMERLVDETSAETKARCYPLFY